MNNFFNKNFNLNIKEKKYKLNYNKINALMLIAAYK